MTTGETISSGLQEVWIRVPLAFGFILFFFYILFDAQEKEGINNEDREECKCKGCQNSFFKDSMVTLINPDAILCTTCWHKNLWPADFLKTRKYKI